MNFNKTRFAFRMSQLKTYNIEIIGMFDNTIKTSKATNEKSQLGSECKRKSIIV